VDRLGGPAREGPPQRLEANGFRGCGGRVQLLGTDALRPALWVRARGFENLDEPAYHLNGH
jgi:hypothetical protein